MGIIGDKKPIITGSSVLIAHTAIQASGGGDVTTTPGIDTTGATLLVVMAAIDGGATGVSIADSMGNTWALIGGNASGSGVVLQDYYVNSVTPTVGSGHTFTLHETNGFGAIAVAAFSQSLILPLDVEVHTAHAPSGSPQPTSLTPSLDNYLVVQGVGLGGAGGATSVASINGSYSITDAIASGSEYGVALAWWKQTTKTATNPTWTLSGTSPQVWSASAAVFKGI